MKYLKPLLLIIVLISALDGTPRGHHRNIHHRGHLNLTVGFSGAYYAAGPRYYDPFWGPTYLPTGYYYHSGEYKLADAEAIITQIEKLSGLRKQGILTEKEFKKAKGQLLKRLGKFVPIDKNTENSAEVLEQLEQLFKAQSTGVLDEAEFARQKKKLLRLI